MIHLKICQNLPIFFKKIQFPEKILHKKLLINSQYSRLKPKKIIATGKCELIIFLAHLELKWASDLGVCRTGKEGGQAKHPHPTSLMSF
jgi:hypothetical protein